MIYAETNAPYLNRIQLVLAPYVGPFSQSGPLGSFNPTRDLQVYVDGVPIAVQTWSFDGVENRYLLFMPQLIDLQGAIQVIHHVPSPPFLDSAASPVLGFALIAVYSPAPDPAYDFLLQENASEFILEDGSGAVLLEA